MKTVPSKSFIVSSKFILCSPKFETTRSRAQSSHDDHGQQRRRPSESLLLDEKPEFVLQNFLDQIFNAFYCHLCFLQYTIHLMLYLYTNCFPPASSIYRNFQYLRVLTQQLSLVFLSTISK